MILKSSRGGKILYILLLNRTNYSRKNLKNFYDDKNGLFIYFPNSQIEKQLNCCTKTVRKMLNNLEKAGLIARERRFRDDGGCTSNNYVLAD